MLPTSVALEFTTSSAQLTVIWQLTGGGGVAAILQRIVAPADGLVTMIPSLLVSMAGGMVLTRAFAFYFELINLAETNHRKRRRIAIQLIGASGRQRGSLAGTLSEMRRVGIGADEAMEWLRCRSRSWTGTTWSCAWKPVRSTPPPAFRVSWSR